MTGLGEEVPTMQLGDLGSGPEGPGTQGWTAPHFGRRQMALPRGPRTQLRP